MTMSVRNRLELIISSLPLSENIDYEIYSGSFTRSIEVTLTTESRCKKVNFKREDFLYQDSDRILDEQEKVELIKNYIKDILFERIVLSGQQG